MAGDMSAPSRRAVEVSASEVTVRLPAVVHGRHAAAPVVLVRAAAAVLISYGFGIGLWMQLNGENPGWLAAVRDGLNRPLRIGEDFGALGVMLLLLCLGHAMATPGSRRPAALARAYLPVAVATLLAVLGVALGWAVWTSPQDVTLTAPTVVGNFALFSHLVSGEALLVPPAWVIGLQLIAQIMGAVSARAWVPPVLHLLLVAAALGVGVATGELRQAAIAVCFFPLLIIGQLAGGVRRVTVDWRAGMALATVAFAAVLAAPHVWPALEPWWYPVCATYAVLLYLVAIMLGGPTAATVAGWPVTRWLAERAVWLLLLTGVICHPMLGLLHHRVPLALSAILALAVTAAAAEGCHRLAALGGGGRR